jgi:hypothetical protein
MPCVIFAHISSAKSEKPVDQFCCIAETVLFECAWLIVGAVLDWLFAVDVGDCAGCEEAFLLARASKSDMIMGRPTKSLTRMCAVAMVSFFR